jgi:hypothetical protein
MMKKKRQSQKRKLEKTFQKVRILSLATPKARRQLVRDGDREVIDCISECCVNILKGRVHLSPKQKSHLQKHREQLRTICKKKISLKKKKEIIQKGGFPLAAILAPVAAALGGLLFNRG